MKISIDKEKQLGKIWISIFYLGEIKAGKGEAYSDSFLFPYVKKLERLLNIKFSNEQAEETFKYIQSAFFHGDNNYYDPIGARLNDLEEEILRFTNLLEIELSLKPWDLISYGMDLYDNDKI